MSNNQKYNSWDDVYYNKTDGYAEQLQNLLRHDLYNVNDQLFKLCVDMLEELKDAHVSLRTPNNPWYSRWGTGTLNYENVRSYLEGNGNEQYVNFLFGTFLAEPQIGYIHINSFTHSPLKPGDTQEWAEKINDIVKSLNNSAAIVLDVRCNGGGDSWAMEYIASRFAAKAQDYIKESVKNGPGHNDFAAPRIRIIKPAGTRYTKPIVLLTNGDSVSAAEWFTLALRTQGHITHAGTATHGAFSGREERSLANGWIYRISPYRITDMDGSCYEGRGISPDQEYIKVGTDEEQLEFALDLALARSGL
jgi:C-terminal processing protease CtpA/Prc